MNPRYERWRRLTFAITWLIYAGFYFTRQAFGVAKIALEKDPQIRLQRDQLGQVDSAYLTTYMLGQFIFGPMGDRFGPRRILLVGMALSIIAAIASGCSTTLAAFVAFAAVQGVAQSTGWSNSAKVMSSWFSLRERGRVLGWWCTHYTVGSAAALAFAGSLMDYFGTAPSQSGADAHVIPYWPAAFWGSAAVLACVWGLSIVLLRNRPEDVGLPPIEDYQGETDTIVDEHEKATVPQGSEGSWQVIREVLCTPSVWILSLAYFSVKLTRYAFYFWGPLYVSESLHSDALGSGLVSAVMPIGGVLGVVATGYISDKLFQARRAPVAILSLLATAAIMFIGLFPINNYWVMVGFFFLAGAFLFGPDSLISATASVDFGTKRGAGTATGFVNGIGSIGGILGGYLPGKITTDQNWTPLFVVMLVGLCVSALLLAPLWRVKPPTS